MDLKRIRDTLQNVKNQSHDLDWNMAVYKANVAYQQKYIYTLSLNYRKTCDWWNKIGDDLGIYLKNNPILEARLKRWYFETKLKQTK